MKRTTTSRRGFCRTLAGISAATLFPAAAFSKPGHQLDLSNPEDALTALIKMRGSLAAEDVPHWYYGTIYAVLPGQKPQPMVNFEGSEIDYYERQPDGNYHGYSATVSFFRDTKTGALLKTFDNPITGKRNEVRPNSISVNAYYIYTPQGYKRSDDPTPIDTNASIADALDWQSKEDDIWLTMRRAYPAGLTMGEHQLIRGSLKELHDPDTVKVRTTAAPTYISPWLRWMDMADHPGHTVWAGPAKKLDRVEDYPIELLQLMEKYYPEKLTAKPG
ncbi:MAG: DUF1838 domain-containing protein [Gammaproteobacteria bacterium]|nr:DUF1838 domain-containing protein [Gammaproteobacteria bacterium]